jgi:hypothetical protein
MTFRPGMLYSGHRRSRWVELWKRDWGWDIVEAVASLVVVLDRDGAVEHIIGTGTDITERKRGEDALREAHDTLRAVIETSPLAARFDVGGDLRIDLGDLRVQALLHSCDACCETARIEQKVYVAGQRQHDRDMPNGMHARLGMPLGCFRDCVFEIRGHNPHLLLFNHTNFDIPARKLDTPALGTILSANAYGDKPPRQIQLGLTGRLWRSTGYDSRYCAIIYEWIHPR